MLNLKHHLKSSKGFTLIELIVCIAIIGTMSAVAVANISKVTDSQKETTTKAEVIRTQTAVNKYRNDIGNCPGTLTALTSTYNSKGPWLKKVSQDSYGKDLQYDSTYCFVYSLGKDGIKHSSTVASTQTVGGDDVSAY